MPIGSLNESSLHAALKLAYASLPGDQIEAPVGGYLIDIVRPSTDPDSSSTLIEIQTGNFSGMKPKLLALLPTYPIRLVHPVAVERLITLIDGETGEIRSRRKSPKRGRIEEVFRELVSLPALIQHPNFSLEVLLIKEEEIRRDDGKGSWRRKGQSIADRRLVEVISTPGSRVFRQALDFGMLLPEALPEIFTVKELAAAAKLQRALAGKMVYCLRQCGAITLTGAAGRAHLYTRQSPLDEPNA